MIINSISRKIGDVTELPRFVQEWEFYVANRGNRRYQAALAGVNPETRNPLNYNLDQLSAARWVATQPPPKSKAQMLKEAIAKGAKIINKKDGVLVYEVTSVEAACLLGDSTSWCTRHEGSAQEYTEAGPLYVFTDLKGSKLAQISLAKNEFNNKKNDRLSPEDKQKYISLIPNHQEHFKSTPKLAYEYARDVVQGRWAEAEPIIAKDAEYAVLYAKNVIQGRWTEVEPFIAKDSRASRLYAYYVIQGRWREVEPVIATDAYASVEYAKGVIQGRFPEGEAVIATRYDESVEYAKYVLNAPFPMGEPAIAQGPKAFRQDYLRHFPEREEALHQLISSGKGS